ncbi:hypothetical protein BH10CHL1_BH10CHL1_07180 [soil metagenome]
MWADRKSGQLFATLVKLLILASFLLFPLVAFSQSTMSGVVNRNANLRSGPGTSYAVTGKAVAGATVTIIGKNTAGDWYQLESKAWIAAFLVDVTLTAPTATPVLTTTPIITPTLPITATLIKPITTTVTISNSTVSTTTALSTTTTFTATGLVGELVKVTSISNGDTIKVALNGAVYKVRYIMVSAPSAKQPLFQTATDVNRTLVKDKFVYLVKDVSDKDIDGNLLRYVYLQDGTFVNAEMVRRGYALLTTFSVDVAKEPEIRKAQEEAIKAGRGVWAAQLPTAAPIVVTTEATLRACPSINCAIVGKIAAGQSVKLIARSADKTWYQLDSGSWLTTFVLSDPPTALPVATPNTASPGATATPTPTATKAP